MLTTGCANYSAPDDVREFLAMVLAMELLHQGRLAG
jgi:hypothetical protein